MADFIAKGTQQALTGRETPNVVRQCHDLVLQLLRLSHQMKEAAFDEGARIRKERT